MSTYDFKTDTTEASSVESIPTVLRLALEELGLIGPDPLDLAEIHILLSGQHGGYDIEIVYAVEDEDDDAEQWFDGTEWHPLMQSNTGQAERSHFFVQGAGQGDGSICGTVFFDPPVTDQHIDPLCSRCEGLVNRR